MADVDFENSCDLAGRSMDERSGPAPDPSKILQVCPALDPLLLVLDQRRDRERRHGAAGWPQSPVLSKIPSDPESSPGQATTHKICAVMIGVPSAECYAGRIIKTFRCKDTERLFNDEAVKKWATIERQTRRKLQLLHVAATLQDLTIPPGSRLETLVGSRKGQHSIRVNDQWRICFIWRGLAAHDVELVDYH